MGMSEKENIFSSPQYRLCFAVAVLFFLLPLSAFANARITEVMYDLPGSDSGREWIEVENTGSATLDISDWNFFENNTNHGITLVSGGAIPPGGYAVIADNSAKFLADWPSFSGALYDSAFSLSQNGELLILRDSTLADIDTLTYDPSLGAAGDGMSLQKGNSAWSAGTPTPGNLFTGGQSPPQTPPSAQTNNSSSEEEQKTSNTAPFTTKTIFADAGADHTVFVGADSIFEARAIGLTGEPIENARFVWTFGNGGRKEGKSVFYNFAYPGVYAVVLDVSSGPYSASDRAIVEAIPALISLNAVTDAYVAIENQSDVELDLGGWILATDTSRFTFPSHTIVLPHEEVRIAHAATGLTPENAYALSLLYPNGVFAASYQSPLIVGRRNTTSSGSVTTRPQTSVPPPTSVSVPSAMADAKTDESQNLIAAPLAAIGPKTVNAETNFSPPFFGWMAALVAVVGTAIGGVFFLRKGTRSGYAIQEVKDT